MSSISRRTFLGAAAATTVAGEALASNRLPNRTLGRTGAKPTFLALGCGSRLTMYETQERGVETVNMAIDAGIGYLDTAQAYGNGKSETWVGEVMKTRRKEVFLATKTQARTYDDVMSRMEESLKRLNTDQVDVLHLHSLLGPEDVELLEKDRAIFSSRMRYIASIARSFSSSSTSSGPSRL